MLIKLPEAQAKALQSYCRQAHIRESEALRQALAQFYPYSYRLNVACVSIPRLVIGGLSSKRAWRTNIVCVMNGRYECRGF